MKLGIQVVATALAALLLGACGGGVGVGGISNNSNAIIKATPRTEAQAAAAAVTVDLSAVANVHGLVNTGSPVSGGGLDGWGYAYSETLTGLSISWGGATFALGVAGTANAVSNVTLALPAGNYSKIAWLATAVNGNQANQTFTVNYTDGTSTTLVQSLSDWRTPQNFSGESKALTMVYRVAPSGATDAGPYYLYGYSSTIDATKIVKSVTLPANRNVVTLAIDLFPASPASVTVDLSAAANVHDLVNTGSPVSGGGLDGWGYAYSETLTGPSISWGGATFVLGVAGTANAVSNVTLALPAGNYSEIAWLATAVNGNQANQTFTVNYRDGTSTKFVQSLSDWRTPQNYGGESKASTMVYRVAPSGATDAGPYYVYGYSFALDPTKLVKSVTLPANRNVVVLAVTLIPATSSNLCDPLAFGAVGDGTTDNTSAIQSAIDACAAQGGGIVELRVVGTQGFYITAPITLKNHVHLQVDQGVILKGTNDHSRYVAAFINWVYAPNEALISAVGATDVGIIGAGIIDGAGGDLQPNGSPSWWTLQDQNPAPRSARPFLIEFYQCDHVTVSGATLRNSPFWTLVLRFSNTITVSGATIYAPAPPPSWNTDGVDVVGSSSVVLTNLNIRVGDDNIAFKSGLPIDSTDPRQVGLPQMATSNVQVTNITAGGGDGIVFGSEAVNGVNNVTIQNVHYTYTGYGIRIKSARDRGGQIYNITAEDLVMNGVTVPIGISDYYTTAGGGPIGEPAQLITPTTPYIHDITIQNVVATSSFAQSVIEGLPESCIHNVTLNNVSIQTSSPGMLLHHMTGTFTNVTSTPTPPNPPFVVEENVTVTTAGTTPTIANTRPLTGQTACSAQVVPPP